MLRKLCALAAVALGAGRIVATYPVFNATYDEPFHLAAGLEWLSRGTYEYEWQHPPLARVAIAFGPWLDGLRTLGHKTGWEEGPALLGAGHRHLHVLSLARLGNLPFFLLACLMLWLWARRWFDEATAAWAVVLFASLPAVLGHAALATLDMGCTATLLTAAYFLWRWWETPGRATAVAAGAALALMLATKFSAIPFLLLSLLVTAACAGRRAWPALLARAKELALMGGVCFLLLWAAYRFHLISGVPLIEFIGGLATVFAHNQDGQDSYLLGEYRRFGWWYFFPVVLAVKTPEAFLLLALAGTYALTRQRLTGARRFTLLAPVAILAFSMTAKMNMGVRHILPLYPFAAVWAASLLASRRWLAVTLPLALVAVAEPWFSHPDYLAYFNLSTRAHAERILAESDLDWGQDLFRLSARLRARGVEKVGIRYFGTVPLEAAGLPPYEVLSPTQPVTGYVAISQRWLTLEYAKSGAFAWLRHHQPIEKIGRSMLLYRIPE